jgi:hypothetical protein
MKVKQEEINGTGGRKWNRRMNMEQEDENGTGG